MLAPEWFQKWPLFFLVENVRAENHVKALIEAIFLPVEAPGADFSPPGKAVEGRKQQRIGLEVGKQHICSKSRRDSAGQAHSATQIEDIVPPHDLRRADEHLPNTLAAFP